MSSPSSFQSSVEFRDISVRLHIALHVSLQLFFSFREFTIDYKIRKRTRRSMTAVRIWLEHSLSEVYVYVAADTGLGMVDIKNVNMIF